MTENRLAWHSVVAEEILEYFNAVSSSKSHHKILEFFQLVEPKEENVDENLIYSKHISKN